MENTYYIEYDGITKEFTEFDDAASYCDAHGIDEFYNDDYGTFRKCWFCGEWFDESELNRNNECFACEMAIYQHGG